MKGYNFGGVKTAVRFLTIFNPWGSSCDLTKEKAAAALPFFPVAGVVAGAVSATAVIVLSVFVESSFVLAAIAVAGLAVVTRGLHLDGVGDCFDALHYFGDRDRALAVMKDKRLGSFGVSAVAFVIAAKILALGSVSPDSFTAALVAIPAISRFGPVIVSYMSNGEWSDSRGLARRFNFSGDSEIAFRAAIVAFAIAFVLCGFGGIGIALVVFAAAFFLTRFFKTAFGEPNGDVHGAVIEICEVFGFMVAGKML
ncbi:adenosylcobinamide-GDP ribazoletransferase [Candidatus Mycalebacterium sp.]